MAELALAGSGAIGKGIVAKVGEYLVDPTLRQFKYMCCFDSNITELETQLEVLETRKRGVQLLVEEDRRNVRVIGPNVEAWQTSANNVTTEAGEIIQDKAKVKEGCLNGWCPNLMLRYSLSKKAVKRTKIAADLQAEGALYTKSSYSPPPACLETIAIGDFRGFESRKLNMEDIINALQHDSINLIGICGMGGTGKTTIAKEVAKRVKEDGLFVEVAWADVGKKPNLADVQVSIADMLGLKNLRGTESSMARANLLGKRLLQDNKRILVILDDVWEEFDLQAMGFSLEGTNFKMLYTSRTRDLWHGLRYRKKEIPLELLSEDEAWQLFREKAGDLADAWDLQPIAESIVDECGCLPLALVLIGCALSKKGGINAKDMWESMLDQLTCSSSTPTGDGLYSRLELSYKYLEDDEAKKLFLLCCLFGEDEEINIEDLVRYAFGLSLFDGMNRVGEVRRRVFFVVDDLKSRYLLLDSERKQEKHVKVHDVVRDMGISVASKGKFALVIQGEVSDQLPKTDINEHYTALSVTSEKIKELPTGLTYPDLKFLMLKCEELEKMPPNFFEAMENLKILELHQFRGILKLQSLRNLTTLSLDQFCGTLENASLIGDLLNLEILSIKDSPIEELPKEIGKLVNLKLLDLSNTCSLIPLGIISRLIRLEELYVWNRDLMCWEGEEKEKEEGRNANLRELELLSNLNTLEIRISEDVLIPKAPIFSKLTTYKVMISNHDIYFRDYREYEFIQKCHRVLVVQSSIPIPSNRGGIDSLLRSSDCLVLVGEGCNDLVQDICCRPVPVRLFQEKTYFRVENCGRVEQVICEERQEDINAATNRIEFPKLEALKLRKLPNLVGFCRGIDHIDFSQLRTLYLEDILQLNLLFHNNSNLSSNSEQIDNVDLLSHFPLKVSLPNLEVLQVSNLQNLVRLGDVQLSMGSLSKLKDVSVCRCSKLLSVIPSRLVPMLQELQKLTVNDCHSLEVLIEWEGLESQETNPEILFALKYVTLKNLPKLNCISKRGFVGYSYIQTLEIEGCNSLRCVFEPTMTKSVSQLRKLKISRCAKLSTIITGENGLGESSVDEVEFPQLKEFQLEYLPSLVSFFPYTHVNGTTLAKSTDHHHNPLQTQPLFNAKVAFPGLENLELMGLESVSELWSSEHLANSFSKLKKLSVSNCTSLRNMIHPSTPGGLVKEEQVSLCSLEVLRVAKLDSLERLVDIPLSMGSLSLSKLKDVSVCNCGKLLSVFPSQLIPMLQELQKLTVEDCCSLEVLIEWEGLESQETNPEILSALKYVRLVNLPKLNCVSKRGFVEYKYVQTLEIERCNSLRCVFEPTMMKSIPQLRKLEIFRCEMLSRIVVNENGLGESSVDEVEFPQLEEVVLYSLPSLVSFFPTENASITTQAKSTDHHHNPLLPQALFNKKDTITSFEYLVPNMSSRSFSKLKFFRAMDCTNLRNVPFISFFGDLNSTKGSLQEVARLLYTNSGFGILALGSNGTVTQCSWDLSEDDPSGKTTASILPQWRGLARDLAVMKNDVAGVNLKEAVPCMALSKNDRYIFSACGGRVSVFDAWTCTVLTGEKTFRSLSPAPTFLAYHPQDNDIMAIGMEDSTILLYIHKTVISELKGHKRRITGLSFSSKLYILASSGADAQVCTWRNYMHAWKLEKLKSVPLQLPTCEVRESETRVQFHSDGIHLLVSHEAQLAIYDASEMDCVRRWVPHDVLPAPISSAVYSCDSQLIYTTFCDANIGVFDADSLMLRYRIAPSIYLDPALLSRCQDVYPTVVAAHPERPNQFAIGLRQGSVILIEPSESEGQWGLSPTVDNVMLNETTASSSTTSNDAPDQGKKEEKGKGILYG